MPSLQRFKNRLIAKLITRYPGLAKRFTAAYHPWETDGEIPWVPLTKALKNSRIALVTTSGVHHSTQPPFNMQDPQGDPDYRELTGRDIAADYLITHDYYDHSDAERDLNIVFPIQRLQELEKEKIIGSLNPRHFAFMGHIDGPHITTLIKQTAPDVARKLVADQVDLVLLTPA